MANIKNTIIYQVVDQAFRKHVALMGKYVRSTPSGLAKIFRLLGSMSGAAKQYGNNAQGAHNKATNAAKKNNVALQATAALWNRIRTAIGAVFAYQFVRKMGEWGGAAMEVAAAVQETASQFGAVFGQSAPKVDQFLDRMANRAGDTRREARAAVAAFGGLLTGAGMAQEKAAELSMELYALRADIQSFKNLDPKDSFRRLVSGLAGEIEPLRRIGISLHANAVNARAAIIANEQLNGVVDEQAKLLARISLIRESMESQGGIGDLDRTIDQLANRQRLLKAQYRQAAEDIAVVLIPTFQLVGDAAEDMLKKEQGAASRLVRFVGTTVFETVAFIWQFAQSVGQFVRALGEVAEAIVPSSDGKVGWESLKETLLSVGDAVQQVRIWWLRLRVGVKEAFLGIEEAVTGILESISRLLGGLQVNEQWEKLLGAHPFGTALASAGKAARVMKRNIDGVIESRNRYTDSIKEGIYWDEFAIKVAQEEIYANQHARKVLADKIDIRRQELEALLANGLAMDLLAQRIRRQQLGEEKSESTVRKLIDAYHKLREAQALYVNQIATAAGAIQALFDVQSRLRELVNDDGTLSETAVGIISLYPKAAALIRDRIEALEAEERIMERRLRQELELGEAMRDAQANLGRRLVGGIGVDTTDLESAVAEIENIDRAFRAVSDRLAEGLSIGGADTEGILPLIENLRAVQERYMETQRSLQSAIEAKADPREIAALRIEFEDAQERFVILRDMVRAPLQIMLNTTGDESLREALRLMDEVLQKTADIRDALGQKVDLQVSVQSFLDERHEKAAKSINDLMDEYNGKLAESRILQETGAITTEEMQRRVALATEEVREKLVELVAELQRMGVLSPEIADMIVTSFDEIEDKSDRSQVKLEKFIKTLRNLRTGVQGIKSLIKAFSDLGEELEEVLEGLLSLVSGIEQVAETKKTIEAAEGVGNAGVFDSGANFMQYLPGIVGIIGGVAGMLGGLLGNDGPDQAEIRDELRQNSKALRENTQALLGEGVVGGGVTEDTARAMEGLIQGFNLYMDSLAGQDNFLDMYSHMDERMREMMRRFGDSLPGPLLDFMESAAKDMFSRFEAMGIEGYREIYDQLRELGYTHAEAMADVMHGSTEALEALGIEFEGLEEVVARLANSLGQYSDTVEGARRRAQDAASYTQESPEQIFQRYLQDLIDAGVDPNIVGQIASAGEEERRRIVEGIFRAMEAGTFDMGDLTADEWRAILEDIMQMGVEDQGADRAIQVARGITEYQANEVIAGLRSMAHLMRNQLRVQESILNVIQMAASFGSPDPAAPAPAPQPVRAPGRSREERRPIPQPLPPAPQKITQPEGPAPMHNVFNFHGEWNVRKLVAQFEQELRRRNLFN